MQKRTLLTVVLILAGLTLTGCQPPNPTASTDINLSSPPALDSKSTNTDTNPKQNGSTMKTIADFKPDTATMATFKTNKGTFEMKLFREEAPLTTLNFISLVRSGTYDGMTFHRVIPGFMAQVGDPLSKDETKKALWGTGGPGYTIADEFGPGLMHDQAGIVSMANAGPNTGGSQFFITYDATSWLDGKHAIFGKITSGMEVVSAITVGDKIESVTLK